MNREPGRLRILPFTLSIAFLLGFLFLWNAAPLLAQGGERAAQQIDQHLAAGETHAYVARNLQAGDHLVITMRATSGNLDPALGIMDLDRPLAEVDAAYRADVAQIAAQGEDVALELMTLRDKYFLAWDDDGGEGYAARLDYVIPTAGDYRIIAGASLTTLGRATAGGYELVARLNAPDAPPPVGEPFLERETSGGALAASVEEATGSLAAGGAPNSLRLVNIDAGETLYVNVEANSADLLPVVLLRDFGGKPLQAANLDGQNTRAAFQYTFAERAENYTLEIRAASRADGAETTGDYRVRLGLNAPEVLSGGAAETGEPVILSPIPVQVGIRIERISEVDSQGEDFTVMGSMRMDWTDSALAYSPDSCDCNIKIYTEKEFDRFLDEVNSIWPDFVFFNQQGNRWVQSRAAAIWPDGRARYGESFTTNFQADFDFRKFPFDNQYFPIYLDLLFPADNYIVSDLPGFSGISGEHGEDEFIIEGFTTASEIVSGRVTDRPVSRYNFSFNAPRHLEYYTLQIFIPILLITMISWFTFFLRDYSRRIEASAANTLLFIAFSFSLSDNYPRLGYITFLDAIMAVSFAFNTLVLLYNVYMKRMENEGRLERVEHIDRFFDWAYPLIYMGMVGLVALVML